VPVVPIVPVCVLTSQAVEQVSFKNTSITDIFQLKDIQEDIKWQNGFDGQRY
jgi:hypothetical protein